MRSQGTRVSAIRRTTRIAETTNTMTKCIVTMRAGTRNEVVDPFLKTSIGGISLEKVQYLQKLLFNLNLQD